jgi:Xaa-Pro aminopeptidase
MRRRDVAALVLLDPINIRYATDSRDMTCFMLRNPARYLFLPLEGPVILFEFPGCYHLADGLVTIDEVRPATTVSFVAAGSRVSEKATAWAREIGDLVRHHTGARGRIGLERVHPAVVAALAAQGFAIVDAQEPVERARAVKVPDELQCIRASLAAVEAGVDRMRQALRPGLTENQLWAQLHQTVIEKDGEYIETRLLASGPRTNPWFNECSPRPIEAGDLVALDTDVIGPFGYYADFSRTFFCGPGKPSDEQRRLYVLAWEQIHHNMALLRPGMTFREVAEKAWPIPDAYVKSRYFVLAHGVGMTGEYPYLPHLLDFDADGYDGMIEPNMTLCVESYMGAEGGRQGVKLEQQVLITERGPELLSRFPFENEFLRQ